MSVPRFLVQMVAVPATFFARRFVAGQTPEAAVAAGRRLRQKDIHATYDQLGEDVLDKDAALRSAEAIKALLRLLPADLDRNVSIKLSMLGLNIDAELCRENTAGILQVAREVGGFVRIDMEGSAVTQATLDVFHKVRKDYDNVGIVLQAYLHRTEADVKQAIERGDRVRLCKGAYKEPASIAWKDMAQIRANFRKCARLLLEKGNHPAIATHDETLVQDALACTRELGIGKDRFEFQMLYGLRRKRWEELSRDGYTVRIYVPYGTHWFPYFYRRLREKKENVVFVLKGLIGG